MASKAASSIFETWTPIAATLPPCSALIGLAASFETCRHPNLIECHRQLDKMSFMELWGHILIFN